jgi:TetR/AcrR family transcriptional regulator, transcriptional repressor for nem operon
VRERLVRAARELFHEQGVEKTTIADIAQRAEMLLGNVYYFRTKTT